jgi:PKD domain-containing protein
MLRTTFRIENRDVYWRCGRDLGAHAGPRRKAACARPRCVVNTTRTPLTNLPTSLVALIRLLRHSSALVILAALTWPCCALALVEQPVTIDGPSSDVRDVGGAALASDGAGGIAYIKLDGGVPHVFVARRLHGAWSSPIRADALPYEARQVAIAASEHGRLLVVWVSEIATVDGQLRYALYSAELSAGATQFGPALVVDPNVGDGDDVSPALAGTQAGRAIVTYRVTTYNFQVKNPVDSRVQLRPNDVLGDVRVARFQGTRWSRLGAINRNPDASAPAPNDANRPRVGLADDGSAVVAWQERDQLGVARIWAKRVFGTSLGPTLPASPTTWQGEALADDADAFALAVSPLGMAQVVARYPDAQGATRVLANQLPVSLDQRAGTFSGAVAADGGAVRGIVGPPAVAVADSGQNGVSLAGFVNGGALRITPLGAAGPLGDPPPTPAPVEGAHMALARSAAGGTLAAWETRGFDGLSAVAVRQEQAGGGVQTGVLAGTAAGDVSQLSLAADRGGDGILTFLQGTAAARQVVAEGITAAPARFTVTAPSGWVRPRLARLTWEAAPSAARVTYSVLLDGDPVAEGLRARSLVPATTKLGNGKRQVQVIATDPQGQAVASDPIDLKVDARPPTAKAAAAPRRRHGRHAIAVTVADPASGVVAARTTCRFGDGSKQQKGHRTFRHRYRRAGRYVVRVVTRDRAGNGTTLRLRVQVR